MLLAEGRVMYAGPPEGAVPYFASLGHACSPNHNPADFMLDLASGHTSKGEPLWRSLADAWERSGLPFPYSRLPHMNFLQ
jgi:hypothetical protein